MSIFTYALFTYALTAVIGFGVVAIILGISKAMNRPGKGDNK